MSILQYPDCMTIRRHHHKSLDTENIVGFLYQCLIPFNIITLFVLKLNQQVFISYIIYEKNLFELFVLYKNIKFSQISILFALSRRSP